MEADQSCELRSVLMTEIVLHEMHALLNYNEISTTILYRHDLNPSDQDFCDPADSQICRLDER